VGTRDVVAFEGGTTTQFQNIGSARVRGLEASGTLRLRRLDLFANYTWVEPYSTTGDEVRFGDIASHQANLGAGVAIGRALDAHLRLNYVGDRPTGEGTTTASNPFSEISGYTAVHAALTYKHARSGARLQLVVNNLFDARYFDPGVRQAGREYAARIPQPGRAAYLRLLFKR
jgi:outer membrane receptor protein involved in Fe transport